MSGSSAWARGDEHARGRGDEHARGEGRGYGAPEPLTMVAVALGAGTVGLAAWRVRRKRS
jgi:hypothetical protein